MNHCRFVLVGLVLLATVPGSVVANEMPLVDAGLDQQVRRGTVVFLDGGGAVDPDGEIRSYRWEIRTPQGRTIAPVDPTAVLTQFVPERVGRYHVTLTVTDDRGATRSDTLYVDVSGGAVPRDLPVTPDASTDRSIDRLPATGGAGQVGLTAPNRPPFGSVVGPDQVRARSSARYTVRVSDVDGRVVGYRWDRATIGASDRLRFDPHRPGMVYTFDVEPGTTITLPVTIEDDDGAETTVSKEVEVLNNPPAVRIIGDDVVTAGTVHRYQAEASDVDGPIVAYSWAIPAGDRSVSTISGQIARLRGGSSGPAQQWFQFEAVPEQNATATLSVLIRDEHGGVERAEKEVVITSLRRSISIPIEQSPPKIDKIEGHVSGLSRISVFTRNRKNPGQVTFKAAATDPDNDTLTYRWSFGNLGYAQTVDSATPESSSTVTYIFEPLDSMTETYTISVTVVDETGKRATLSRDLTLKMATLPAYPGGGNIRIRQGTGLGDGIVTGVVTIPNRIDESGSRVSLHFGDGTSQNFSTDSSEPNDLYQFSFRHRYDQSGKYTLFLVDTNRNGASMGHRTIEIQQNTFTEYHYQVTHRQRLTTVSRYDPGQNWTRSGIDHYERKLLETERTATPLTGITALAPGEDWTQVGTTTEQVTETITETATSVPGPEWRLQERGVDSRHVFDGWETITVDRKAIAQPNWQYVGRVSRTTTYTQSATESSKPDGSGWRRVEWTGDHEVDRYDRTWVSSRYFAGSGWRYVRSDSYVERYRTSRECVDYANFLGNRYCTDWQTTTTPIWDIRYLYEIPRYSRVYTWERTVERQSYDYRYRFETYREASVNRYSKTVTRERDLAVWERRVYEEYPVYIWESFTSETETVVSLEPPDDPTATNVSKHTHQCGTGDGAKEQTACEGDQ